MEISKQIKDLISIASGIGCGIVLYIVGGKLGKMAGQKIGSKLGAMMGSSVGKDVSKYISSSTIGQGLAKLDSSILSRINQQVQANAIGLGSKLGASAGTSVGNATGKAVGAAGGYAIGKVGAHKALQFFTNDQSKITDYFIMLEDQNKHVYWLGSSQKNLITSNPNEAVLFHKGQGGISSRADLQKKIQDDKFDQVFKGFKVKVFGINANSNLVSEGVVSTALKTAGRIIGKAVVKTSPKAAKLAKNPAVRRGITVGSKKLIKMKAFRQFIKKLTTSKVVKKLGNKNLIKGLVKAGDCAMYADTILTAYDMVSDFTKGKYKDISPQTAAAAAGTIYYVSAPGQVTTGDDKLDAAVVQQGLKSIQGDLQKYKAWKRASNVTKESISSNYSRALVFEQTQFFKTYVNILFQSASTNQQKFKVIQQVDPEFASMIKKSVQTSGHTKVNAAKVQKVFDSKNKELIAKMKNSGKKVSKENVEAVLKHEGEVKSLAQQIFSKETLMSLIPFSTKPTLKDIQNGFAAMHHWIKGDYSLDQNDKSQLISIGLDVGITSISLAIGGTAAFATFGISAILAILGCAATIGYIFDSITRIGRNFENRGLTKTSATLA